MKLRHTKYPYVKISLPAGGHLQFEGFVCFVSPQTIENNGESFFDNLINSGKVIVENKHTKKMQQEEQELKEIEELESEDLLLEENVPQDEPAEEPKEENEEPIKDIVSEKKEEKKVEKKKQKGKK